MEEVSGGEGMFGFVGSPVLDGVELLDELDVDVEWPDPDVEEPETGVV